MFAESDLTQPVVLLTIVSEEVLKDSIIGLLKNLKVRGYTLCQVVAEDRYGQTMGSVPGDGTNVEIKALMSREISEVVLHTLKTHRGEHAVIAYRQEVEALTD
jgi:hypothetical protein